MIAKHQPGRQVRLLIICCLLLAVTALSCTSTPQVYTNQPQTPNSSYMASSTIVPSMVPIVNKVLPSVVYFYVQTTDPATDQPIVAAGSGVILRPDGYILTNRHVVDNPTKVEITLYDRRVYQVSKANLWMDDIVDLAVAKIDENNLPALQWGDPNSINVGDWVMAVGHALGMSPVEGGATVTKGIVSNLGRSFTLNGTSYYDLIQTDAAINPGNSGGPLVDMVGDVIGIDSAGVVGAQNISFAINVGTARHVFEDLVQYGKPHHPYLGVDLGDITPDTVSDSRAPRIGALITNVQPDSPGEKAGLRVDDIIISYGQVQIDTAATLIKEMWRSEVADKVDIVFWRNGIEIKVNITLGQRPGQNEPGCSCI